ncbi:MAG: ABC transporter substrate-binding protein [Alphaproteobacteria bacterium]
MKSRTLSKLTSKRPSTHLTLAVALAVVLFASGSVDAQPREKIRVALGSVTINSTPIPIGKEAGIFAKYGIDVEAIHMGGGVNSLAALTSGSVQFLSAGSSANVSARLAGADVVTLAVQSNRLDYILFASPDIHRIEDLKGKIVTGTRPGASADSALRMALRKWGLEPDKDVIFISVAESQQGRLTALQRGAVAATLLSPPFTGMAKKLGLRELADLRRLDIEFAGSSIAAMGPYIRSHPATVENFLKAYVESIHFMKTQRDKSVAVIMKYLKMNDRARAEEGYDYYVEIYPQIPYPTPGGIRSVLQFLAAKQPKAATAAPEEFYDTSFLKRIEESGFVKALYSKK